MKALGPLLGLLGLTLAPSFACDPVVGTPFPQAPINACGAGQFPCDRYVVKGATKATCNVDETTNRSRCDFGRPSYPYTIVVNVPDSSFYAAGRTLVLTSNDLAPQPGTTTTCQQGVIGTTQCIRLPEMVAVEGKYRVTDMAARALGKRVTSAPSLRVSIPVRVAYVPFAPDSTTAEAATEGLPLQDIAMSSLAIRPTGSTVPEIKYVDTISVGRYQRVAYPEPPFDVFFPPAFTALPVKQPLLDDFVLGATDEKPAAGETLTPLDDDTGATRVTTISRAEGLDGWRVYLIDKVTRRRISTVKTLAGVKQTVVLHTVGWNQPGTNALLPAFIVVVPPAGQVAVPRLETEIVNGAPETFKELDLPALAPPTKLTGNVVGGDGRNLIGLPSRLHFTSTGLRRHGGEPVKLLTYATSLSTDEAGHFETVLPPGFYDVTIEPAEFTGFSKVKESLDTTVTLTKDFKPPLRSTAFGHVVLADGRPLAEANISALPSEIALDGRAVKPRPVQTRTDQDGNFRFVVDQGQYDLTVDPRAGTDFPRVVQIRSFGAGTIDVGEIVVPPPARIAFVLRDQNRPVGNPIVRATVRVFAEPPGRGPPAIEIGRSMTGADGRVEILLAPQAR